MGSPERIVNLNRIKQIVIITVSVVVITIAPVALLLVIPLLNYGFITFIGGEPITGIVVLGLGLIGTLLVLVLMGSGGWGIYRVIKSESDN